MSVKNKKEHSELSPSSSSRWCSCPGSMIYIDLPEQVKDYTAEGTKAHDLAAYCLNEGVYAEHLMGFTDSSGKVQQADDKTMVSNVNEYLSVCYSLSEDNLIKMIEQSIDLSKVYGIPEQFGRADFITYDPEEKLLTVIDYKNGYTKVSAKENKQGISYALGAVDSVKSFGEVEKIKIVIVQPAIKSCDVWECTRSIADSVYLKAFRKAARRAWDILADYKMHKKEPDGSNFTPSEENCRFCKGKGVCKALAKANLDSISDDLAELIEVNPEKTPEVIEQAVENVTGLSNEQLSTIYSNIGLISNWINAVQGIVLQKLIAGESIPGYKAVLGSAGNRKWSDDNEVEKIMKSLRLKKDEMYSFKIISPAKAEKLLKSNPRKWARLDEQIIRGEPKPVIVPEADKRPAYVDKIDEEIDELCEQKGEQAEEFEVCLDDFEIDETNLL